MFIKKLASVCNIGIIILGLSLAVKLATMQRAPEPDVFQAGSLKKSASNLQAVPPQLQVVHSIVCMGDSITKYAVDPNSSYSKRLEQYLAAVLPEHKITVINKGVDREHSGDLRKRWQKDAIESGANLVIIFVGVNDVGHGFTAEHPHGGDAKGTPLPTYLDNVKSMIKDARANLQTVLLVTPPTFFEDVYCEPDKMLETYAVALRELAGEEHVLLADVRKAFVEISGSYRGNCDAKDYLLTVDGVHPNSLGNKVITECILSSLGISSASRAAVR